MYGKKYMGVERSTFLIDKSGKLVNSWRKVKVPGHAEEVLAAVRSLSSLTKSAFRSIVDLPPHSVVKNMWMASKLVICGGNALTVVWTAAAKVLRESCALVAA